MAPTPLLFVHEEGPRNETALESLFRIAPMPRS